GPRAVRVAVGRVTAFRRCGGLRFVRSGRRGWRACLVPGIGPTPKEARTWGHSDSWQENSRCAATSRAPASSLEPSRLPRAGGRVILDPEDGRARGWSYLHRVLRRSACARYLNRVVTALNKHGTVRQTRAVGHRVAVRILDRDGTGLHRDDDDARMMMPA